MTNAAHLLADRALGTGRPFLLTDGSLWTYDDVDACARRVASFLRARGIGRGGRIALSLQNGAEFVCAYFGGLRAGAVVVALAPDLGGTEACALLADSGARLLFTGAAGAATIGAAAPPCGPTGEPACEIIVIAAQHGSIVAPSLPVDDGAAICERGADAPAAIVYSSGTEGTPKGVLLSHGNITFTARAKQRYMRVREDDRLLLFLPMHHCFGQNAVMNAAVAAGAALIIQPRFDAAAVLRAVAKDGATMFFGVPTVFSALLDLAAPRALTGLRYFFSAAAPLPPAIEERWLARFGLPIHQGYGLSESSPFATYNHAERLQPETVGTAIEGVEIRVVDPASGAALPAGAPGEVVIRGPNVMLGYWNRPEATARAIRGGWLHTGDIGRLDAEGYLSIDDRLKDIIVVGGGNVSPVEVEKVLCRHPAVREAAVFGVPEPYLGEEVHAAVVLRPGHDASGAEILAGVRDWLAPIKRPSAIEIVPTLPKAPTGKILRRVLREAAAARAVPGHEAADDEGALRPWLEAWFGARLGVPAAALEPDRPLMEYGLNSILGVALARDLSQRFGRPVPPTLVWEQPTLAALLRAWREHASGPASVAALPG